MKPVPDLHKQTVVFNNWNTESPWNTQNRMLYQHLPNNAILHYNKYVTEIVNH
jgi:hypothetical protein